MAIRVSRQRAEVLAIETGEIRVSRQMAEVLAIETGEIRVSRQQVEVLVPDSQIYDKSATSTLSLGQSAVRDVLIFERSTSSTLSLGQSSTVNGTLGRGTTNTLEFTQIADTNIKQLSAFSVLVLEQVPAFPGTYLASATSILELTDSAVNSGLITANASSTLELVHYADHEIKARDASNTLTLIDTATVDKILRGFSTLELSQYAQTTKELFASSTLELTQMAWQGVKKLWASSDIEFTQSTWTNIKNLAAESTLALTQSNVVLKPIYVSAESELTTSESTFVIDEWVTTQTGLRQEAIVEGTLNVDVTSYLSLGSVADAHVALASGISASASSTIVFSQKAIPEAIEENATSELTLTQTAIGLAGKPAVSILTLTQIGSAIIDRGVAATSTLDLQQASSFTLIIGTSTCQYSPFVGSTTDPNAPTPPPAAIDGPMVGIQVPFQLVYPSTGVVTDSVALKTPSLGNKDRLSFQRILRETRGGTLIVFADPIWPKVQTLVLTFTGLLRVEAQELLTFIDDHLGLEIGLIDWEHRYWRGVVVTPDEPVIEDRFDYFTVNFEFEGELDPTWNPQVVPPGLRYSATRSAQDQGYYVPIEPTIPTTPETWDYYEAEADSTIVIGNPVYLITGTGHVDPAQANSSTTAQVAGLSITDTSAGGTCKFLTEGRVERSDWSAIAGVTNLSAGVFYYLDPSTAGRITSTAPTTPGQYVVRLGRAVDTTTLDIEIELPILL